MLLQTTEGTESACSLWTRCSSRRLLTRCRSRSAEEEVAPTLRFPQSRENRHISGAVRSPGKPLSFPRTRRTQFPLPKRPSAAFLLQQHRAFVGRKSMSPFRVGGRHRRASLLQNDTCSFRTEGTRHSLAVAVVKQRTIAVVVSQWGLPVSLYVARESLQRRPASVSVSVSAPVRINLSWASTRAGQQTRGSGWLSLGGEGEQQGGQEEEPRNRAHVLGSGREQQTLTWMLSQRVENVMGACAAGQRGEPKK